MNEMNISCRKRLMEVSYDCREFSIKKVVRASLCTYIFVGHRYWLQLLLTSLSNVTSLIVFLQNVPILISYIDSLSDTAGNICPPCTTVPICIEMKLYFRETYGTRAVHLLLNSIRYQARLQNEKLSKISVKTSTRLSRDV